MRACSLAWELDLLTDGAAMFFDSTGRNRRSRRRGSVCGCAGPYILLPWLTDRRRRMRGAVAAESGGVRGDSGGGCLMVAHAWRRYAGAAEKRAAYGAFCEAMESSRGLVEEAMRARAEPVLITRWCGVVLVWSVGSFINAGATVFCLEQRFLAARVEVDEARLRALWPRWMWSW